MSKYESTLVYLVWPMAELLVTIIWVATPAAIRPLFVQVRRRAETKVSAGPDAGGVEWVDMENLPEDPYLTLPVIQ